MKKSSILGGLRIVCVATFVTLSIPALPYTNSADEPEGKYRDEIQQYAQNIDFRNLVEPNLKLLSPYLSKKPAERLKGLQKAPNARSQCHAATHTLIYNTITLAGQSMAPSFQYAAHSCAALTNWLAGDREATCAELVLGVRELQDVKRLPPVYYESDIRARAAMSGEKMQTLTGKISKAADCAALPMDMLNVKAAALKAAAINSKNAALDDAHFANKAAIASRPADPPAAELVATMEAEFSSYEYNLGLGESWQSRGDDHEACTYYFKALSALRKLENATGMFARVTGDTETRDSVEKVKTLQSNLFDSKGDRCIAANNRLF